MFLYKYMLSVRDRLFSGQEGIPVAGIPVFNVQCGCPDALNREKRKRRAAIPFFAATAARHDHLLFFVNCHYLSKFYILLLDNTPVKNIQSVSDPICIGFHRSNDRSIGVENTGSEA